MNKLFFGIGVVALLIPLFVGNTEAFFRGKRPPINVTKPRSSQEIIVNSRRKVTNRSYRKTWEPKKGTKLSPSERHIYGIRKTRVSARIGRTKRDQPKKFSLEKEKPIRRSTNRYSGISSKEYLRGDRRNKRISHKEKQERFLKRKLRSWDRFELSK